MSEIDYWQRLAELRGELVGALMSRNTAMAATLIDQIAGHERNRPSTSEGTRQAALRKMNIDVALEEIQRAVNDLEHLLS